MCRQLSFNMSTCHVDCDGGDMGLCWVLLVRVGDSKASLIFLTSSHLLHICCVYNMSVQYYKENLICILPFHTIVVWRFCLSPQNSTSPAPPWPATCSHLGGVVQSPWPGRKSTGSLLPIVLAEACKIWSHVSALNFKLCSLLSECTRHSQPRHQPASSVSC